MADDLEDVALRKLLFELAEDVDPGDEDVTVIDAALAVVERINSLESENEELRDKMADIQSGVEAIQELGSEKTTKEEKVAQLVSYAQNQLNGRSGRVALTVKEIKGTAGVTRRYAYDLLDDLPEEYDWLLDRSDVSQYGDLQIDKSGQDRALVVDFELLHEDDGALNKFTTGNSRKGASA